MAIKAGDTLPTELKLKEMGEGGPTDVTVGELTKGKTTVLFAVPGAFTPTCSMKHRSAGCCWTSCAAGPVMRASRPVSYRRPVPT